MKDTPSFPRPELLLAAIIDSSEDAILSKDLHSIITSWNKAAERMFGYTAEEMIGQSVSRMFPPDRVDEETRIIARIRDGERIEHLETVRRRKDGTLVDVSLTISPIRDSAGEIIGASKFARDITQQKRAMRELHEANEELKRADRLKAEFVATLSHELRTPLSAIIGWTQLLQESPTEEEMAEGVRIIDRNARVQAKLVEDLLDMSRIELGKISLDMQRLDLDAVTTAALETVRPAAEAKGIHLTSAFSSIGGTVTGDRNRIQQILWNLLTNAIKFTPKNGRIHVVIERADSHFEISVVDNGQGIAAGFLGHVFDRFRQGDASDKRVHGGLGVGLSIAKQLTELHGGSLQAASPGVGLGATFTIQLPVLPAHSSPEKVGTGTRHAGLEETTDRTDLRGVKVLVVDDEPDCLTIISRLLQRRGAEVCTASSMREALAEFPRFSPDVILSDINMPEHDGYELISRVRALPGGRSVPAVALTALARTQDRTRALRAGYQLHLAKPADATELIAVVHNLASLRGHLS